MLDSLLPLLPLYLLLGAVAGIMAGLLGVGGGLIIVPALLAIFASQTIATENIMHLALGTSLASIIITSFSSAYAHHQHNAVLWNIFKRLSPGLLIGAYMGAWLASKLNGDILKPIFAIFEICTGLYMLSGFKVSAHTGSFQSPIQSLFGLIIGTISALVGIGGGTLTVPYLLWQSRSIHQAVATSAACGLPIALAGSSSYLINGWFNSTQDAIGYIHLPALLGITISSILFAPLGARLAHRLPVNHLKKIFAIMLLLIGGRLLFSSAIS